MPNYDRMIRKIISPFLDPIRFIRAFPRYLDFLKDLYKYSSLRGAEKIRFRYLFPMIHEKAPTHPFDPHYFYQDFWAFDKIHESKVKKHVDVGSKIDFISFLTTFTKVAFVELRKLKTDLKNFEFIRGDILAMPFKDNSIKSLSCLSVAEHIGLGRYGDRLDPRGTERACKELQRVLAPNGNLYFSLPVGKPRVCFNAHRIHSTQKIIEYFDELELVEFSAVNDGGRFLKNISPLLLENSNYSAGLFHFRKKPKSKK